MKVPLFNGEVEICHKTWSELEDTGKGNVRFCDDCSEMVFLVCNDKELTSAIKSGVCVAGHRKTHDKKWPGPITLGKPTLTGGE